MCGRSDKIYELFFDQGAAGRIYARYSPSKFGKEYPRARPIFVNRINPFLNAGIDMLIFANFFIGMFMHIGLKPYSI